MGHARGVSILYCACVHICVSFFSFFHLLMSFCWCRSSCYRMVDEAFKGAGKNWGLEMRVGGGGCRALKE